MVTSEIDLGLPESKAIDDEANIKIMRRGGPFSVNPNSIYKSPRLTSELKPNFEIKQSDEGYLFSFPNTTDIWVQAGSLEVATSSGAVNPIPYLLAKPLSLAMELMGRIVIHATCCSLSGQAIGMMGHSSAGKSTMSMALQERGLTILSDDVIALDPGMPSLTVHAGPGISKLWPDSCQRYMPESLNAPQVVPGSDKKWLVREQVHHQPCKLKALILLDRVAQQSAPELTPIAPEKALTTLIGVAHVAEFENLLPKRKERLRFLAELATKTPTYQLTYPTGFERLKESCERLVELLN